MSQPLTAEEKVRLYEQFILSLPQAVQYTDLTTGFSFSKGDHEETITYAATIDERPFDWMMYLEQHLQYVIDFVPYHIMFVNPDGIITSCNQCAAMDLGYDRKDVIGRHIRDILQLNDDEIFILRTLHSGEEYHNKEILDTQYGLVNTRIWRHSDGSIGRVIGTFLQFSFTNQAERLALAGRIAAGIAHEIRNPLTTVRGYLQYFAKEAEPKLADIFSTLLIPEIDRANKIIGDFLKISKEERVNKEAVLLYPFLQRDVQPFLEAQAHLAGVKLDWRFDGDNPTVCIDKNEWMQIFTNLLYNAIDARHDERPLHIRIVAHVINGQVAITFSDNGIGIPQSIIDHIFDPFFSTKDTGTGLGLSVTRKMIENHHGTIRVNSNDYGTNFVITLDQCCS